MQTVANKPWVLRIYAGDAQTIKRVSRHVSRAAAFRALAAYESKRGRHCNAIDKDGAS
jgi:hypothetical protein